MNNSSIPLTDRYAPDILFLVAIGALIVIVLAFKAIRLIEHNYSETFSKKKDNE